jgi:hypothetical protein
MAIAASRAVLSFRYRGGVYTGCIGFDRAYSAYARRRRLSAAVTGSASLRLVAGVNRRKRLTHRRHRVDIAVTAGARRKIFFGRAPLTVRAVCAHDLLGSHLLVAARAIHRLIKPTPVFAIRTDMAVKTLSLAVRCAFEVNQIDFFVVALETGMFLFGVTCLQSEQQTGNKYGEELMHSNALVDIEMQKKD